MSNRWQPPLDQPILDEGEALRLLAGDLGDAYRQIIMRCCRPLYWYRLELDAPILANGTVTFVRTPERLLGVTAAHVLLNYLASKGEAATGVQLGTTRIDDLGDRIIRINEARDMATFDLEGFDLARIGGEPIVPLATWPPLPPQEGRGIMLGGFPGLDRQIAGPMEVDFGLFTALGIARRVTDDQITWMVDRDHGVGDLPPNYDLGGISGGPLISKFLSNGIETYRLAGIVSEAQPQLEYVVAKRADILCPDGTFDV